MKCNESIPKTTHSFAKHCLLFLKKTPPMGCFVFGPPGPIFKVIFLSADSSVTNTTGKLIISSRPLTTPTLHLIRLPLSVCFLISVDERVHSTIRAYRVVHLSLSLCVFFLLSILFRPIALIEISFLLSLRERSLLNAAEAAGGISAARIRWTVNASIARAKPEKVDSGEN